MLQNEPTSEHKNFIFLDEVGFSVVVAQEEESPDEVPLPILQFLQLKAKIFQL